MPSEATRAKELAGLTPAQKKYLAVAAQRPIRFEEVRASASNRCANALVKKGLLLRDVGRRSFVITKAGRALQES